MTRAAALNQDPPLFGNLAPILRSLTATSPVVALVLTRLQRRSTASCSIFD
jgi:hypothetical protein